MAALRRQIETRTKRLKTEELAICRELGRLGAELARTGDAAIAEKIATAERRLMTICSELAAITNEPFDEDAVAVALADFDTLWKAIPPRQQVRTIELFIERIVYDGHAGTVAVTYYPNGFNALATLQEATA